VKKSSSQEKANDNPLSAKPEANAEHQDAVCGMRFAQATSLKADYQGRTYFFCSENCRSYFLASPAKYLSETPLIEMRNVSKVFPLSEEVEVVALQGVDLKIFKGDFVAIMGPSGSGKSTLMNIIGLLDTPTHGEVFLNGTSITSFSDEQLAGFRSQTIGFVFQQFNLLPHMTALENVLLPRAFTATSQGYSRVEDVLNRVGLFARKEHKPNQLSGGEQQRTAIARALINNPEILIADEPTGNLDSKTGEMIMELLKKLNQDGRTVIVVTHDPGIARCAEKLFQLKDGRILANHMAGRQFLWQNKNT